MTDEFIPPAPLQTAVLFLVFNRPDTTAQVFEAIRKAKPPRLYVAADGPREGRAGEADRVAKVREIATAVDWPCEVKTLFREENLGCKYAVSGAITWFFEHEEQGIILEDDCLPSLSFFWFCEELLYEYKDDETVGQICGRLEDINLLNFSTDHDYFLTSRGFIWGWATWKRSAIGFEVDWINEDRLWKLIYRIWKSTDSYIEKSYRLLNVLQVKCKAVCSWAYPWNIRQLIMGRKCILPTVNLVSNIGSGECATHTVGLIDNLPLMDISFPLIKSYSLNNNYTEESILKNRSHLRFFLSSFFVLMKLMPKFINRVK